MDIPRPKAFRPIIVWAAVSLAAIAVIGILSLALVRWRAAPPTIERDALFLGKVSRQPFLRSVQGPGVLEPVELRWLSAAHAGRVERLPLKVGDAVHPDTVVVELFNPEMQLQALEVERDLVVARTERLKLSRDAWVQESKERDALATLLNSSDEAERRRESARILFEGSAIPVLEFRQAQGRATELSARVALAHKRIKKLEDASRTEQLLAAEHVATLERMVSFHRAEVRALKVTARIEGILQSTSVEVGQWVTPGALLATVARSGALKATLRISEVQAREVALGQVARIDTRNGVVEGRVSLIAPAAKDGTVAVEAELPASLPQGARAEARVDGSIIVQSIREALTLALPAKAQSHTRTTLFRVEGDTARRVPVEIGSAGPSVLEIRAGAREGDQFVLSDMSRWDGFDLLNVR